MIRLVLFAAIAFSFLVVDEASAAPRSSYSRSQVCPPGTSAGACLDNAFAAIDDLERRVSALESAQSGGSTSQSGGQSGPPSIRCTTPAQCCSVNGGVWS